MKIDSNFIPASPVAGVVAGPAADADAGRLGRNTKSVDRIARNEAALGRFAAKSKAAQLLRSASAGASLDKAAVRVSHCGLVSVAPLVSVALNETTGRAFFSGIMRCGNVWLCPCCSPKISAVRRDELNDLLSAARSAGLMPVLLTLTARHDISMKLAVSLDALKRAKQRFRQRREWRALPFEGSVTATEVTFGRNGWHCHFHEILLIKPDLEASVSPVGLLRDLLPVWLRCLAGVGLSGNARALDARGADAAGAYVAKWGAADELALDGAKSGRNGSRSPWQLLDDARDGCCRSAALWLEYAQAFKGRRQLVWSRGLRKRFEIGETSDADAAAAEAAPVEAVRVVKTWFADTEWKLARRRRQAILEAVESGSCLDAAVAGPADCVRWRRLSAQSAVIDDYGGGSAAVGGVV